jgi:hypothetical protein
MDPDHGAPLALGPWARLLHDPSPFDLVISASFIAVIGIVSAVGVLRRGTRDRLRWSAVAVLLAGLLVNQQGDFHAQVKAAGSQWFRQFSPHLEAEAVTDLVRGAVVLGSAAAAVVLLAGFAPRGPAWPLASVGLLLLLAHAVVRVAADLGAAPASMDTEAIHPLLKAFELAGLACIAAAALRSFRRQRPAGAASGPALPAARVDS